MLTRHAIPASPTGLLFDFLAPNAVLRRSISYKPEQNSNTAIKRRSTIAPTSSPKPTLSTHTSSAPIASLDDGLPSRPSNITTSFHGRPETRPKSTCRPISSPSPRSPLTFALPAFAFKASNHPVLVPQRSYSNPRTTLSQKYPTPSRRPNTTPTPPRFATPAKAVNPVFDGPNAESSGPSVVVSPSNQAHAFHSEVQGLQDALWRKDVASASSSWASLEASKRLHLLGPAELERCSRLISVLVPSDTSKSLKDHDRIALENIAVYAATGRATFALRAFFMYHLQRDDSEAILSLYDRFLTSVRARHAITNEALEEQEELDDGDTALASTSAPNSSPQIMYSEFLIFAIAAHALRNDMPAAAQTALQSPFRLPYRTALSLIRTFKKQDKFVHFFEQARLAGLVAHPPALMSHVSKSVTAKAVAHLERVYNGVIAGLTDDPPWLSASTTTDPALPVVVEPIWMAFLKAFLELGRIDWAEQLWNDMTKAGIRPSIAVWNVLLQGIGSTGDCSRVMQLWDIMRSQDVQPDGWTYQAVVITLMRNGRMPEAEEKFKEFHKEAAKKKELLSDTTAVESLYNAMISGYLFNKRETEADELFEKMKEEGPSPSIITYNTFMSHHQRLGNFKAISSTLQAIRAAGLKGDPHTFSALLMALLQIVPRTEAIARTRRIMQAQGVRPDAIIYSTVISHLLREREPQNLKAAMDLLAQMEADGDPELHPTAGTYTAVLLAIHRWEGLAGDLVADYTDYITRRMRARKIPMNKAAYNALIKACLANRESTGVRSALRYYREMVTKRVELTHDTWYILIHGLLFRKEIGLANQLVDELEASGLKIKGSLASMVASARAQAVAERNTYY